MTSKYGFKTQLQRFKAHQKLEQTYEAEDYRDPFTNMG